MQSAKRIVQADGYIFTVSRCYYRKGTGIFIIDLCLGNYMFSFKLEDRAGKWSCFIDNVKFSAVNVSVSEELGVLISVNGFLGDEKDTLSLSDELRAAGNIKEIFAAAKAAAEEEHLKISAGNR